MAASEGRSGLAPLLLCRVAGKLCGVPLERVVETMRALPIEPLAGMSELALGLSMIRGRPTPVVDGRRLLGADASAPPKRFVTLEVTSERTAALAVDDVLDVRHVSLDSLTPLPGVLGGDGHEAVSRLGALDRDVLLVLQSARLLPESFWRQLKGQSAP